MKSRKPLVFGEIPGIPAAVASVPVHQRMSSHLKWWCPLSTSGLCYCCDLCGSSQPPITAPLSGQPSYNHCCSRYSCSLPPGDSLTKMLFFTCSGLVFRTERRQRCCTQTFESLQRYVAILLLKSTPLVHNFSLVTYYLTAILVFFFLFDLNTSFICFRMHTFHENIKMADPILQL